MSNDIWQDLRASATQLMNAGIIQTGEKTMKEHHFIVKYDEATRRWSWDADSEEVRFESGTIYDGENFSWASAYLGDGEYDELDCDLGQQLSAALQTMNGEI